MPEYKITEKDAPPISRGRRSPYAEIVADFMARDIVSALIEVPGRKPTTVQQGLIKAVKVAAVPLKVRKAGDEVYLVKK